MTGADWTGEAQRYEAGRAARQARESDDDARFEQLHAAGAAADSLVESARSRVVEAGDELDRAVSRGDTEREVDLAEARLRLAQESEWSATAAAAGVNREVIAEAAQRLESGRDRMVQQLRHLTGSKPPAEAVPAEDPPAEDPPAEDQPAEDQPAEDQAAEDQPPE